MKKKERIFIGSDFHGQGKVYFGLINYLENLQMKNPAQKIVLYINGDIIDRGADSMEMLLDAMERVKGRRGNIEVRMMAGNHELTMYEAIMMRRRGVWANCGWLYPANGGYVTKEAFEKLDSNKQNEVTKFLRDLPIAVKFDGGIVGKEGIILAHACPPRIMKDIDVYNYNLSFAYIDDEVADCLWKRKKDLASGEMIGIDGNLVIIGHTKTCTKSGYKYDDEECVLNIDGGCAVYEDGEELSVPIVELDYSSNRVNIIGFDEEGKIKYRKLFAADGEIKNLDGKNDFNRRKYSSGGKYYNGNNKTVEVIAYLQKLAEVGIDEFLEFVKVNRRRLAALGLLVGALSVGSNVFENNSEEWVVESSWDYEKSDNLDEINVDDFVVDSENKDDYNIPIEYDEVKDGKTLVKNYR